MTLGISNSVLKNSNKNVDKLKIPKVLYMQNSTVYFPVLLHEHVSRSVLLLYTSIGSTHLLAEPRYRTIMVSRAFHTSAPKEWNRLPLSLHSSNFLPSFKSISNITISSWLSSNWKVNWMFTWWLSIRASDSHFCVT